jgi:replicative DNA helicase
MVSDPQLLKDLLQIEIDRIEASEGKGISGLSTGYPDLDEMLRGLQKGEMIILAARPSMGKTALALNLAEQIALGGGTPPGPPAPAFPVAVFSLEMSKSAVTQRLLSAASGIDSQNLRSGHASDAEFREACFGARRGARSTSTTRPT